jgi:hypothetical protein
MAVWVALCLPVLWHNVKYKLISFMVAHGEK